MASIFTSAIIPAAGTSTRLNQETKKQFIDICGFPLIFYPLKSFQESELIDEIVLVTSEEEIQYVEKDIVEKYSFSKVKEVVIGGALRQDSVREGFNAVSEIADFVVIHDAARPLIGPEHINNLINEAKDKNCVITAMPVKDTLKIAIDGIVKNTYPRDNFWRSQTPQVFRYEILKRCYDMGLLENAEFTDEAQLVEYAGFEVNIIVGSEYNIKITTDDDLNLAKLIINGRSDNV